MSTTSDNNQDEDPYKCLRLEGLENAFAVLKTDKERVASTLSALSNELSKLNTAVAKVSQQQQQLMTRTDKLERRARILRFESSTPDERTAVYHERLRTLFYCWSCQINDRYDDHFTFRVRPNGDLDEVVFALADPFTDTPTTMYIEEKKYKKVYPTERRIERKTGNIFIEGELMGNVFTDDLTKLLEYL